MKKLITSLFLATALLQNVAVVADEKSVTQEIDTSRYSTLTYAVI